MSGPTLLSGGGGFAGRHLVDELRSRGEEALAPSRDELDLLDGEAVRRHVAAQRPAAVLHLAAQASVPRSWEAPRETLATNLEMTLNVLEAVRAEAPEAFVLVAGSGEIYGAPESLPVEESAPLRPQNPYAVSKAACDLLAQQYADAHGLHVVRTRSFNHAGPGQGDEYVVGTICRQVAEAELAGKSEVTIRLGNVDSRRDFTDVRDVVRAYADAREAQPGAFNLCSGEAVSVRELLDLLRPAARVEVRHEVDPARVRSHDVPEIRGSAERFSRQTGWRPQVPLERTLADALEAWREEISAG